MSYIAVGKIAQPYGLQGYVKIFAYSEIPERFFDLKTVYIESDFGMRGFIIEDVQLHNQVVVLKLQGVDSREMAQTLIKQDVWAPEEQKVVLSEGDYFIHDLLGLQVFDGEGILVGELVDVLQGGGNDVYLVQKGDTEILIPAVSEFIRQIDLPGKKMIVQLIEGMGE